MNRHSNSPNPSPPDPPPPTPQPLQQVTPPPLLALPPPPPPQPPPSANFLTQGLTQNQRRKRTKLIPVVNSPGTSSSSGAVQKKKYSKPDPNAPVITEPCSECGRQFWSWKALFGHMRCHPERQWRGINPPPNLVRPPPPPPPLERPVAAVPAGSSSNSRVEITEEDHDVAASLLLLANGGHHARLIEPEQCVYESAIVIRDSADNNANCRFECSCCKKVFNSHQALGGHRASHKNVKGCFANTYRPEGDYEEGECGGDAGPSSMALVVRHSCSICSKVFSTGQALGGHMRCHWDKGDDDDAPPHLASNPAASSSRGLDLNMPAPADNEPSSSSGLRLDLRLGL